MRMVGPGHWVFHSRMIGRLIRAIALGIGLAPAASDAAIVQYSFDPNTTSLFGGFDPHTGIRTGPQKDSYSGSFFFDTATGMTVAQNAAITVTGDGPGGSPTPYNVASTQSSFLILTHLDPAQRAAGNSPPGELSIDIEFQPSLTGTSGSAVRLVVDYLSGGVLLDGMGFDDTSAVTGGVSLVPSVVPVPEPSSLLALATGAGVLLLTRRSARLGGGRNNP